MLLKLLETSLYCSNYFLFLFKVIFFHYKIFDACICIAFKKQQVKVFIFNSPGDIHYLPFGVFSLNCFILVTLFILVKETLLSYLYAHLYINRLIASVINFWLQILKKWSYYLWVTNKNIVCRRFLKYIYIHTYIT